MSAVSNRDLQVELRLENLPGEVKLMGARNFSVPREAIAQTSMLITLHRSAVTSPKTKLSIGVYGGGKRIETINTVFVGPRNQ